MTRLGGPGFEALRENRGCDGPETVNPNLQTANIFEGLIRVCSSMTAIKVAKALLVLCLYPSSMHLPPGQSTATKQHEASKREP